MGFIEGIRPARSDRGQFNDLHILLVPGSTLISTGQTLRWSTKYLGHDLNWYDRLYFHFAVAKALQFSKNLWAYRVSIRKPTVSQPIETISDFAESRDNFIVLWKLYPVEVDVTSLSIVYSRTYLSTTYLQFIFHRSPCFPFVHLFNSLFRCFIFMFS